MGRMRTPAGFTGGEDIPGAISSLSNLRIVPGQVDSQPVRERETARSRLPEVGYGKIFRCVLEGTLDVVLGTGTATAKDPYELVRHLDLTVQNATTITGLPGPMMQFVNDLDRRVLNNRSELTVDAGANRFYLELYIEPVINEQNLLGLVYMAGTYPYILTSIGTVNDIVELTGDATASFSELNLHIYQERIDAEQPVNPRRVMVGQGENRREEVVPGEGLWEETSKYIQTSVERVVACPGPNQQAMIDLPLGKRYLRIMMIAYRDGVINTDDDLMAGFELWIENNTRFAKYDRINGDMFFRDTYYKERPGGHWVMTYMDRTASDRDILHTQDLGRLQLYMNMADTAPAPADGNEIYVALQQVVDLTQAAAY